MSRRKHGIFISSEMNKNYFHSLPSVLELPEWKMRLVLESDKVGKVEMFEEN